MRNLLLVSVLALLVGCTPIARVPTATPQPAPATSSAPAPAPVPTSLPPISVPPASPTPAPPTPAASTPAPAEALRGSFAAFAADQSGQISLAFAPVGSTASPTVFGDLGRPVAWSTSKVPLAIAVERTPQGPGLRPTMKQAITASDTDAATQLWQSLGQPTAAAAATDRVLRDFGDPTTRTQSQQVRPPYTAFGQTQWTLADQTRFAAQLPCRSEAAPVYAAMGQVIPEQSWGLGRLPSVHFKGGWGPSSAGYLVRQFGVVDTPRGQVAVAVAVDAPSFDKGTATLSRAAQWLGGHIEDLPAGSC